MGKAASKNADSDALDAFLKHYEAFTELYHDKLIKDKTLMLGANRGKTRPHLTRD